MRKILFLDRDGTLIFEPPVTFQVNCLEEMFLLDNLISSLKKLTAAGFELILVTNQDGLGTEANPRENYENVNKKLFHILATEGVKFSEIFECPHYEEDNCNCRKPKTGMLDKFLIENRQNIDFENSYVIGDSERDMELAKNIGVQSFKIAFNPQKNKSLSWKDITSLILDKPRTASIKRKTKETEILINLNLDGNGKYKIDTGVKFFDHMLEQLGKHGNFDLEIKCLGDLEIDEHHTIEDVGLALGRCFKKAIGDKRGIIRYAHEKILPMDEALGLVAIDFSGRPHCEFVAKFSREYVGDFPTEMLGHFYKSFSDMSGINLNIKLEGDNTHHLVEVSFKAFARCLKEVVRREGTAISSTKGVL
jgi:imidazoleglycerol-phosphate dehydratase/histidinol-phosphatase